MKHEKITSTEICKEIYMTFVVSFHDNIKRTL